MIRAANRFMEELEKRAITLEAGPDGKLTRVEPEGTPEPETPRNDPEA